MCTCPQCTLYTIIHVNVHVCAAFNFDTHVDTHVMMYKIAHITQVHGVLKHVHLHGLYLYNIP